jgi:predicted component of type VI protein secretion system
MSIRIHWQEGLFLQPHHLQRMQKSIEDEAASERRLSWPYPYG